MSIHRFAAKRDANEPEIRKRFAHHGWHTEQVSQAGKWDLDCYAPFGCHPKPPLLARVSIHVDVKDGGGGLTKAQVKKWTALHAEGIRVYVVRTEADVDALVRGTLRPWEPEDTVKVPGGLRKRLLLPGTGERGGAKRMPTAACTPSRSKPVDAVAPRHGLAAEVYKEMMKPPGEEDYEAALRRSLAAAKEAEVFAPPDFCEVPSCNYYRPCPRHKPPHMGKR